MTMIVSFWVSPRSQSRLARMEPGFVVATKDVELTSAVTAPVFGLGISMGRGVLVVPMGVTAPDAGREVVEIRWTSRRAV